MKFSSPQSWGRRGAPGAHISKTYKFQGLKNAQLNVYAPKPSPLEGGGVQNLALENRL